MLRRQRRLWSYQTSSRVSPHCFIRSLLHCCRQTLEAELKLLREDCHRVALELQQRRLRVNRLQAKFDVLAHKHAAERDEKGQPRSQAYYVIKSAQEREELKQSGDTLDAENERLQKEVR